MRDDIIKTKLEKLENLKKAGMDPYPEKTERSFTNAEAIDKFDSIKKEISLVGRVKSFRSMGNAAFAHMEDGTGKIQILFKKDRLGEKHFEFFKNIFGDRHDKESAQRVPRKGRAFPDRVGLEVQDGWAEYQRI